MFLHAWPLKVFWPRFCLTLACFVVRVNYIYWFQDYSWIKELVFVDFELLRNYFLLACGPFRSDRYCTICPCWTQQERKCLRCVFQEKWQRELGQSINDMGLGVWAVMKLVDALLLWMDQLLSQSESSSGPPVPTIPVSPMAPVDLPRFRCAPTSPPIEWYDRSPETCQSFPVHSYLQASTFYICHQTCQSSVYYH